LDDIPDREESFWHQVQALLPSETLEGRGILMQGSDGLNYQEPKQEIPGKAQSPLMPLETRGGALLRDGGTFQSWLPPGARLDNRPDPWAGSVNSVAGTTHIEPTSRPEWADAMGRDRFGLWVEVIFKGVTQRMRWIPPGRFLMGAAKDEPEADADAKPQHWVTLTQGYWLADTPCTQELWHAVMNEDPSHFKGTALPVESVTFKRVEQFCRKLTKLDRSPPSEKNGYRLPTEAQWEYACRAGGHDETYNRPWEAGALDQIAWYGNSPGDKTQPVKGKRCNRWGLHDMLGNVWELCSDMNEPYKAEAQIDPIGKGSERVYRGGSCWVVAGNVRPAYRLWWFDEHVAFRGLGFRLSRGHAAQDRSGIGGADGA
ncbi:MAG: formylglycine-generating enzyme family protein, partial [bacterium]|nr:formylglycine-generating enzyme family protein [bacterium]